MSKTHRRREEPDRKAAAVVAEKEKVVDLHGAMRDLIEDTDKYISDKFGDSPLPGTAPQGSKKTRRRDQGSISTTPTGTTFEEQTEPPIDDLHKSIEGLKEETSETLVKVQTAAEVGEKVQEAGFGSVYDTPEYLEYVQSGQGIRQAMEAAPDTLTYITEAPEGYYYRGQDVQEHNAKVREYNHQVREYKRKLQDAYTQYRVGLITYDSYEVQRKSYEAQLKLYEAEMKRTAQQREAFGDYLRSIGPPEPTEEQRMRMDAGMPLTGIPGPANVPPPGSISAKIQPIVQEGFERTLRFMELPFKTATEPIRDIATGFKLKSIEAEMEGEPWAGFGYYAAGTALKVVGAGIDVATFEYRPGLWVDVSRTLTGLAVNPEARTALIGEVARDPFGFAAEMAGGAYLGRYVAGKIQAYRGPKKTVTTRTDPMAYRKIQKTTRITTQPPAYKVETKTMKIGSGFERTQAFIPEDIEVVPGFVSSAGESSVATPFSKGSYPVAAYDKTLWGQTGAGLRQLSEAEAITIPESMVETQTIWRMINERGWKPGIETPIYQPKLPKTTGIIPSDYLSRTVTSLTITPRTPPSLIGLLGLGSQIKINQPIIPAEIQRRAPVQITKPTHIPKSLPKIVDKPKLGETQIPSLIQTPTQIQKQIQMPTQIQKPILELDIPQITMPDIPEPERPFPDRPAPPEFPPPEFPTPDDTDPLLILGTGSMKRSKLRRRESELMGWERREYRLPTPDSELFLGGGKSRRSKDNFLGFSKKRKSIDDDLLFPRKKKRGKGIDLL